MCLTAIACIVALLSTEGAVAVFALYAPPYGHTPRSRARGPRKSTGTFTFLDGVHVEHTPVEARRAQDDLKALHLN